MKKILCFWCDNEVEKDGQLCPSCQKRYDQTQKEYEQIDKEYKELFGDMDCKGMIEFVRNKDKKIKELEQENQQLKQQLHKLPKKIVSEIRKKIGNKLYRIIPEGEYCSRLGIDWCEINRILDTILKKYGGEDE